MRVGLLLLFALALCLRARAVEHGQPHNYVPDTHVVRSALGMAQDKDPIPPVGKYSTYPNLVPYMLLPLYGGHFAWGRMTGRWHSVEAYKFHVVEHPEEVHRLARWLMLLFGAATPWVVFRAARAMGLEEGAWAAAFFVASGLMHLHFSVQERPWVALVFFAALSSWPAALHARNGRSKPLVLAGVFAALAASCHQAGLPILGLPGLAWLVSPNGWSRGELAKRLRQGVACVAVFFLVALVLGYPAYLRYGMPTAEQTIGGTAADASIGGQSINFGRRWETFPHLAKALFGYEPLLLLLGLAGMLSFLRRRSALPAGIFALGWGAFFMTHSNDHVRYLLPVAVLLCLPAGVCVQWLWRKGPVLRVVLCTLAVVPLVQSARLGTLLERQDTRAAGEALLRALPQGSLVAIDRYGPDVALDRGSLELLHELRRATGGDLYKREAVRLERLKAGVADDGVHALYISDLFEIEERTGEVTVRAGLERLLGDGPDAALRKLGVTHLMLVNRLHCGLEGNLMANLVHGLEPIETVRPTISANTDSEARLPMELEFPLTSLWALERSGPWLGLYRLP